MDNAKQKAWTREVLEKQINTLEQKNVLDSQKILLYVLNPYVASLGYNIFNIDDVDTNVEDETITIKVSETFSTVVSLNEYYPLDEMSKVFLHLDIYNRKLSLYMKALGEWELLHQVDLKNPKDDGTYNKILDFIVGSIVKELYKAKKERLFTEGVLRSKLNKKDYYNAFVREIVREELKNPSKAFIQVIATGLTKRFSSENPQSIANSLNGLQDLGIVNLFSEVIEDIRREEKDDYSTRNTEPNDYTLNYTQELKKETKIVPQKEEEKVVEILEDTLEEPKEVPIEVPEDTIEETDEIPTELPEDEIVSEKEVPTDLPEDTIEEENTVVTEIPEDSLDNIFKVTEDTKVNEAKSLENVFGLDFND